MCGIAGVVALREGLPPPPLEALQAMAAALRHRGPDEFGLYRDARAGLAHARLSIIDPLTGQQPLGSPDGRLWVVFNGEIFNYVELRAELAALGYRFATRSDTEVIVRAYEAWGERAFARFNGQFAIALWDSRNRSLVLARDRHGIQPLHLCERGGRLWFASEVKALFAGDPSLPRRFDPLGLAETFTFWSVVPPQSVFQGIEELRPGHVRTLSARGSTECAFWSPRYPAPEEGFRGSIDEAAERVRAALEEAVRQRVLRADVPVGSYLSGGLDSSLIAALARRANRGRFLTFSIRFADAEYDETPYQRAAAALIGSEHREIVVTRHDIAAALPEAVRHAERPILRTAPVPLFLLSRLVRDAGIKVVLTGEGADEMFAGYDLFRPPRRAARACSSGSIRISPARRLRSAPWRSNSSAATAATGPRRDSPTRRAGARPRRCSGCSSPGFFRRSTWWSGCSPICPRSSAPGRRSRRTSTSRRARCSRATCSLRRATGC